jgi:hypothetical protein
MPEEQSVESDVGHAPAKRKTTYLCDHPTSPKVSKQIKAEI